MYDEVLHKIVLKEKIFLSILLFVILIILFFIWKNCYKKIKKSEFSNKNDKVKKISTSFISATFITCILILSFTLLAKNKLNDISKINLDINNSSYETYTGGYYIHTSSLTYVNNCEFFLDNGLTVYKKDNTFFKNLTTLNTDYYGTVIYGKNSLIVVDVIEKN